MAQEQLQLDHSDHEMVLTLRGEIDLACVPDLTRLVESVSDCDDTLVFDMTEVSFMDSSGLKVLALVQMERGARGPVHVRGASERVRHLLALSGLDSVIAVDGEPEYPTP